MNSETHAKNPKTIRFYVQRYYIYAQRHSIKLDFDKMVVKDSRGVDLYYNVCLGKFVLAKGRKEACEEFIVSSKRFEFKKLAESKVDALMKQVKQVQDKEVEEIKIQIDSYLEQAKESAGPGKELEPVSLALKKAMTLAREISMDISLAVECILNIHLVGFPESKTLGKLETSFFKKDVFNRGVFLVA